MVPDLELLKFVFRACKYYYPSCVSALLIFENPGMLKAPWMLLRTLMSTEMQHLLRHVTRTSLPAFVPLKYIPMRYGGEVNTFFFYNDALRITKIKSLAY
ncbi:unnamed protein product [Gongylonema pulchrum]|uniref:CRAL-TRIO domain-containing protein n=1 Tax=Gongylonema pulchrum TaxID=637853 RepID=A0A183E833_9BILA|nr:unnamed protein product [Gongylonema pulchrum]